MSAHESFEKISHPDERRAWLRKKANWIRLSAMSMTHHAKLGHTGGDLSRQISSPPFILAKF